VTSILQYCIMIVHKFLLLSSAIIFGSACAQADGIRKQKPLTNDAKRHEGLLTPPEKPSLNMTLCTDKCTGDCKSYVTPVSECYNSGALFPNDPSWSARLDVLDTVICQTLIRTIFHTSDGSCTTSDSDDRFQIPLEECVGPFGEPRPWGTFSLISSITEEYRLAVDC
jgi:hypothetical protein